MKKIILGSNSPRRRDLLGGLDLPFTVDTGNSFEESVPDGASAEQVPLLMALGKSHGFHRPLEDDEVLITADTVVIIPSGDASGKGLDCSGTTGIAGAEAILGKPHDREDAVAMLRTLSGRTHKVVTSVVIRDNCREECFSDTTFVSFDDLSDDEIAFYIDKYKPFDKAGAYGVPEWIGYVAMSRLEGSFYNVMGFPVHKVYKALQLFK